MKIENEAVVVEMSGGGLVESFGKYRQTERLSSVGKYHLSSEMYQMYHLILWGFFIVI